MASDAGLGPYVGRSIAVITNDGRNIVGTLRGFDQLTNLILEDCHERVFSTKSGVDLIALGVYMLRGDNIAIVGEVDDDADGRLDFSAMRAAPLKPVSH